MTTNLPLRKLVQPRNRIIAALSVHLICRIILDAVISTGWSLPITLEIPSWLGAMKSEKNGNFAVLDIGCALSVDRTLNTKSGKKRRYQDGKQVDWKSVAGTASTGRVIRSPSKHISPIAESVWSPLPTFAQVETA